MPGHSIRDLHSTDRLLAPLGWLEERGPGDAALSARGVWSHPMQELRGSDHAVGSGPAQGSGHPLSGAEMSRAGSLEIT